MSSLVRSIFLVAATCGTVSLIACASHAPRASAAVPISTETRTEVFEAARTALRECGYRLDRVDSALGVLTTQPSPAGGVPDTSTPLQDLLHEQTRTVRVEFDDRSGVARVECFVSRTHTPEVRLSTRAIGLSATTYDPIQAERGTAFRFESPLTRDDAEAQRIARRIERELQR
ncbi:MAG TPA: hypothetical protein VHN77_11445 [Phycisphaerales bacterium]|nr:hypothetical protein [Phycisphaerales bacterium]